MLQKKEIYEFGPYRLDSGAGVILRDGELFRLTPKVLDTLLVLVENAGKVEMMAGISRALKPGGRLGVIGCSAPLGLKWTDYMERHFLPQESLIDQVTRGGLRLVSFDPDFAGPPDGARNYFAVFEKPRQ